MYALLARSARRRAKQRFLANLSPPARDAPPMDWVIYALRAECDLAFSYKGQKDFEPRRRRARPVSLETSPIKRRRVSEPGFVGVCRDSGEQRTFLFSRMRSPSIVPASSEVH